MDELLRQEILHFDPAAGALPVQNLRLQYPYHNIVNLSVYHPTSACSTCPDTDCFDGSRFCINTGFFGFFNVGYGREIIRQQLREEIIMRKHPKLWWQYV